MVKPWVITRCEQCEDWEDVYYCIDCKRFYCTHCLIDNGDHYNCPSGEDHKIFKVEDYGKTIRDKLHSKINELAVLQESLGTTYNKLLLLKRKANELNNLKLYHYFEILNRIYVTLKKIDDVMYSLLQHYDNLKDKIKANIHSIFRHLNNQNYTSSKEQLERLLEEIRVGESQIQGLREEADSIENEIRKTEEDFSKLSQILLKELWEQEYIYNKFTFDNKRTLVITNKRILLLKKRKITRQAKLEHLGKATTKKKMFFTGIILPINGTNEEFKIPCNGYECLTIIENINYAKMLSDKIQEFGDNFAKMEKLDYIEKHVESLIELKEDVLNLIDKTIQRNLERLLGRFYYNGNSFHEFEKKMEKNNDLPFHLLYTGRNHEKPLAKPKEKVPITFKKTIEDTLRNSNELLRKNPKALVKKLVSMKNQVKQVIDEGNLDETLIVVYHQLNQLIDRIKEFEGKNKTNNDYPDIIEL